VAEEAHEDLLDDGRRYWKAILSNHQEESSRVIQEAHWRQQVADSARRTLDTLHDIFIFYLFVFVLLSARCFTVTRSPRGEVPWMIAYLPWSSGCCSCSRCILQYIYILRRLDQPKTSVSITHRVFPRQILQAACP
jgi:hypothetical protein